MGLSSPSYRPDRPGTPGIIADDFVGASHEALVAMIQAPYLDAEAFRAALVAVINECGATHNQRSLLDTAFGRATRSELETAR